MVSVDVKHHVYLRESYRSCNVYTQWNREFETRLVAQLLHPRHGGRYFSDLYLLQTTEALPLATVEEKQFQTPGPLICFAHYITGELPFRTVAATCVSGGENYCYNRQGVNTKVQVLWPALPITVSSVLRLTAKATAATFVGGGKVGTVSVLKQVPNT